MFYWIYNVCLYLALPVIAGLLIVKKRLQRGIGPRLGIVPPGLHHLSKPVIWVHAVSFGEVVAVVPLLRSLKREFPDGTVVVSTVTETGREVVNTRLSGIAHHCYAPLDFSWAVKRYVKVIDPNLFILVEAEFWPNLLRCLQAQRIPVCLVNGRMSSRSFSRHQYVRGFMKQVLGCLNLVLMQSRRDAERMRELGVDPARVCVTGNLKFDQAVEHLPTQPESVLSRASLGLLEDEVLWVAGSTHPQEEEKLLEAYQIVLKTHPDVVLMLAPRHIERTSQVENVVGKYGFSCVRRSWLKNRIGPTLSPRGQRVIILDTRGELSYLYQFGRVAFVGGTLVPVGGHNLLEPAQWGIPVLFGPSVDHCEEIAGLLQDGGGGLQVQDVRDLARHVVGLLEDIGQAKQMGERARTVVQQHRGVVQRTCQMILDLMKHHQDAVSPAVESKVLGHSP